MKDRKRQLLAAFVTAGMVLSNAPIASFAKASTVKSIAVTNLPAKVLTLKKGKSKTIKVKVTASKKADQKVVWKTSNKKIATVKNGKVKALKKGKVTITAMAKSNTKKKVVIKVTVGTPVTAVKLSKKTLALTKGKTATVKAQVSPTKASNKTVIWKTTNKKIATVKNGKITAVGKGTTKVSATAQDGSGKSASVKVTVANAKTTSTKSTTQPSQPATTQPTQSTQTATTQPTSSTQSDVKATGLTINEGDIAIEMAEKKTLTTTLTPSNVTDSSIRWDTSDYDVATVDQNRVVTGEGKGTATITATNNASGLSASVTVSVADVVTVHNQSEVSKALIDYVPSTLIIDSDEDITLDAGMHTFTSLVVKGSNRITNNGVFNGITLAGTNTFYEDPDSIVENVFTITDAATLVTQGSDILGPVKVNLSQPSPDKVVTIENDSFVSQINILTPSTVNLKGGQLLTGNIKVNILAENVTLNTEKRVNVNATEKANLVFSKNAAGSTVTVDHADHMPNITGTGSYEVTNSATGEKTTIDAK